MFAKAILFAGLVAAKAHYDEPSTTCDDATSTAPATVCYDYVNDCGVAYGGCIPATETPTWTAPACPDSTGEPEEEEDCEDEEEYEEEEEEEDCEEYDGSHDDEEDDEEEYEESHSTSTIVKTVHYTVTSCPPVVEDCPYGQESTVVITTTYCPDTEPTPVVTVTACPGKEMGYGCSGGEVEEEEDDDDEDYEYPGHTYPPTTASAGCYDGHCGGYGGANSTMMTYTPSAPATTVVGGCSGAGCGGGDSEEATETGAVTAGVAKVGVSVMAIVAAVFAL